MHLDYRARSKYVIPEPSPRLTLCHILLSCILGAVFQLGGVEYTLELTFAQIKYL